MSLADINDDEIKKASGDEIDEDEWLNNVNEEEKTYLENIEDALQKIGDGYSRQVLTHTEQPDSLDLRIFKCTRDKTERNYSIVLNLNTQTSYCEIVYMYNLANDVVKETIDTEGDEEIDIENEQITDNLQQTRITSLKEVNSKLNQHLIRSGAYYDLFRFDTGDIASIQIKERIFPHKDDGFSVQTCEDRIHRCIQMGLQTKNILNQLYNLESYEENPAKYDPNETLYTQ